MEYKITTVILSVVFSLVAGAPFGDFDQIHLEDVDGRSDSQIVQSLIREVRATPEHLGELVGPDTQSAFLRKYTNDKDGDDNEQGYQKHTDDEGGKGYKHYDSYHKKDGDKYGVEHRTSYGLENKGDGSGHSFTRKVVKKPKSKKVAQEADGGAETKNTYKVVEDGDDYDDGGAAGSSGNYEAETDGGHYDDGGESGHYSEGDGDDYVESAHYTSGSSDDGGDGDGESEHYESADGDEDDDY